MSAQQRSEVSRSNFFHNLDEAVGITRTSKNGMPTLFYAVSTENEQLVCDILKSHDKDFDINVKTDGKRQKRYTALHVAAKLTTAGANIVSLLLNSSCGADVGARDARGYTPLDWCFERMKEHPDSTSHSDLLALRSVFSKLLMHKADINSRDGAGKTILDKAREYKWTVQDKYFGPEDRMISFLIQNGAE